MASLFTVDHVTQTFALKKGGYYTALKDIFLDIAEGEFVSLVGHSGCGKSTLLNLLAGLTQATEGGILMNGRQITAPGPERMVVFQNYSLLPWKTVRQNISLAVDNVFGTKAEAERAAIVEHNIKLVNLKPAADKFPHELSGGMKQRVAIARALAIRPKLLLLDEPFGALDALTRGNLQQQLLRICDEAGVTTVMVTHDVDEALLLSDRVVLMTNGPEAHIGQILEVPLPRPRNQLTAAKHPSYYALRAEMVGFLNDQRRARQQRLKPTAAIAANGLEKVNLSIGFIPLSDCAPLVVAKAKGYFQRHGLEQVELRREANWKSLETNVRQGVLDAAQMVAGLPYAMTMGLRGQEPLPVVTALTLSRNGNAITLHRSFQEAGVHDVAGLRRWITANPQQRPVFAMVHQASMHNFLLRAWLASGGIDPDLDVELIVIPPPQMVATLRAGTINGFCVGEPWNSRAIKEGLGTVIAADTELWNGHCEKVLGVREDWASAHPRTHEALVRALLEACRWCEQPENREELAELLSRKEFVGADVDTLRPALIGPFDRGVGEPVAEPQLLRFHGGVNAPERPDAIWIITQLARWGICPLPVDWQGLVERVQLQKLYRRVAAAEAAAQGDLASAQTEPAAIELFGSDRLDLSDPLAYLQQYAPAAMAASSFSAPR